MIDGRSKPKCFRKDQQSCAKIRIVYRFLNKPRSIRVEGCYAIIFSGELIYNGEFVNIQKIRSEAKTVRGTKTYFAGKINFISVMQGSRSITHTSGTCFIMLDRNCYTTICLRRKMVKSNIVRNKRLWNSRPLVSVTHCNSTLNTRTGKGWAQIHRVRIELSVLLVLTLCKICRKNKTYNKQ